MSFRGKEVGHLLVRNLLLVQGRHYQCGCAFIFKSLCRIEVFSERTRSDY